MTFEAFFSRLGTPQADAFELAAAGFTHKQIAGAVRAGRLRQGVTGYWLPARPDPGAVLVMRAAMRERPTVEVPHVSDDEIAAEWLEKQAEWGVSS